MRILVVDSLARGFGRRYASFDVAGAGPRVIAGICSSTGLPTDLKAYELVMNKQFNFTDYVAILISAMSSDLGALAKLIDRVRYSGFKGIVVVGGPISFDYRGVLSVFKRVDYVIVGEGELPLINALKNINALLNRDLDAISKIPSLAYKLGDEVLVTSRHVHTPVDVLSSVKPWVRIRESYPHHRVLRYYVEVLRGCSNFRRPLIKRNGLNCIDCGNCLNIRLDVRLNCPAGIPPGCGFCSVPYMFGPPRSRSVKSIVEEIAGLVENGAERIVLSAPDFLDYGRELLVKPDPLTDPCKPGPNVDAIEELLSSIWNIEEVSRGKVHVMVENIKSCLVNEDVVKVFKRYLEGTTVHIGVETGDDWFNEYVLGKPIKVSDTVKALKLLKKAGLRPYVYLMYNLPFANNRVYDKTIYFIKKAGEIGVEKITLYRYIELPGTAFSGVKGVDTDLERVNLIKKLVGTFNKRSKMELIGRTIAVYVIYSKGRCYGYPVKHGPVVFIKDKCVEEMDSKKCLVKITEVKERFVYGEALGFLD